MKIAIIDYGQGNINSVANRLKQQNVQTIISSDSSSILEADKIILPGVGHFATAMGQIHGLGILAALNEAVLQRKTPVLGICLGMQLMANYSEEGNVEGLKWVAARVVNIQVENPYRVKVPHTGWNGVKIHQLNHPLLKGIPQNTEFYFTHSYQVKLENAEEDLCSAYYYGQVFSAGLSSGNIFGVQFHPEKSHKLGQLLIDNFVAL